MKFVYFHPEDVVRHRLVRDILQAFDQYHARVNGHEEDGVGETLEPETPPAGRRPPATPGPGGVTP